MNEAGGVPKRQLTRTLGLLLFALALALALGAVLLAAQLVIFTGTGANRGDVFVTAAQQMVDPPPDQTNRVTWLPDAPRAAGGRTLEPVVRRQIAEAYLNAWTQLDLSYQARQPYGLATYFGGPLLVQVEEVISATLSSPWRIRQSSLSHSLELSFYTPDGSIAAVRDRAARLVQQYTLPDGEPVITTGESVYNAVLVLDQGNWRVRAWRREADAALPAQALPSSDEAGSPPGLVSVSGDQLQLGGQPFRIAGANYYPPHTPWTLFWANYDPQRTSSDLQIMAGLGLNTARIFVPFDDFGGEIVDPAMVARLEDFLNQAAVHNIKVIVTLFDHRTDHRIENWGADELHLAAVVAPLARHPAVLAWDIKNEADRDDAANTPARNLAWLRHMAGQVRRWDPHHLITVGWSTPQAAAAAPSDFVDFVSFHYYGATEDYAGQLADLRAAIPDKPLLLGEYGQTTWRWLWPANYLEDRQAEHIAAIRSAPGQAETAGEVVWALFDFSVVPLDEFRFPWQKAMQAHMGVLRTDGSAKPAAAVVSG